MFKNRKKEKEKELKMNSDHVEILDVSEYSGPERRVDEVSYDGADRRGEDFAYKGPERRVDRIKREKEEKKMRRKRLVSRTISNIILLICILVFCWSAFQLYLIYDGYKEGDRANVDIQSLGLQVPVLDSNHYWKYYVDFDELLLHNQDTIAWIRFDEPEIINYPVVASKDNAEYLSKTFKGGTSIFGTIFSDMRNATDFSDQNTILYGHNMKNGSMFGSLKKFKDATYLEENPYFYIYTNNGMAAQYLIIAVQEVAYDSWHYQTIYEGYSDFVEYVEKIQENSMHNLEVEVPVSGKIVTLSTCTASDAKRLVVQGVKIEERPMEIEQPVDDELEFGAKEESEIQE